MPRWSKRIKHRSVFFVGFAAMGYSPKRVPCAANNEGLDQKPCLENPDLFDVEKYRVRTFEDKVSHRESGIEKT